MYSHPFGSSNRRKGNVIGIPSIKWSTPDHKSDELHYKNIRIMEIEAEPKAEQNEDKEEKASSDGESEFEERTSEMDRIVLHSEVPASRTCAKGPNVTPGNLGNLRKDTLNCITCAAQTRTSFFKYEHIDVKSSAI
eukprot:11446505-Heterocapsa_arctica.AAC.1